MASSASTSTNVSDILIENDIPWASLEGRKATELKADELNFGWSVEGIQQKVWKQKRSLLKGMYPLRVSINTRVLCMNEHPKSKEYLILFYT